MQKKLSKLRSQIRRAPLDRRGRRRYPAPLRRELTELARAWRETSSSQRELAEKLGLSEQTLASWLYSAKAPKRRRTRVKKVEVIEDRPKMKSAGLSFVLPTGARIEGLDVRQVVAIAREIG